MGQLRAGILSRGTVPDGVAIRDYLDAGFKLEVVGYSLGAHVASVFTEIHVHDSAPLIERTTLFNAAGRGAIAAPPTGIVEPGRRIAEILRAFDDVLANPLHQRLNGLAAPLSAADALLRSRALSESQLMGRDGSGGGSIYSTARSQWARRAVGLLYDMQGVPALSSPGTTVGFDTAALPFIDQVYGHATHDDAEYVANSGIHAPVTPIFIEDQPEVEGFPRLPFAADVTARFDGDFGNTHSLTLVVDSLALMRAFMLVDPALTQREVEAIFAASSNQRAKRDAVKVGAPNATEGDSLENALDGLRKLFRVGDPADPNWATPSSRSAGEGIIEFREDFYRNLNALENAGIAGKGYRIVPFVPTSQFHGVEGGRLNGEPKSEVVLPLSSTLLDGANSTDPAQRIAYRYALRELNPFIVTDPLNAGLYSRFQPGQPNAGELESYDAAIAPNGLTPQYLTDRTAFLERKLYVTAFNLNRFYANPNSASSTPPDSRGQSYRDEAKQFEDRTTSLTVGVSGGRKYIFGTDRTDAIQGGTLVDSLYGGKGTDFLDGKGADDYLEGGAGQDIYQYSFLKPVAIGAEANDGNDTIRDSDGRGVIRVRELQATVASNLGLTSPDETGTMVVAGVFFKDPNAGNVWKSADGKVSLLKVPGLDDQGNPNGRFDLVVTFNNPDGTQRAGTMKVKDWNEGDLGIRLVDAPTELQTQRTLSGDFAPDLAQPGNTLQYDTWGNVLTTADPAAGRADSLFGRDDAQGDYIAGGGGVDVIFGDTVQLQAPGPRTTLESSTVGGADWIDGGDGDDQIDAGPGNDLVEGGFGEDIALGGSGNDRLYGVARVALDAAVRNGESDQPSGLRGELLGGGEGDDWVVSDVGNDLLFGGTGTDVLVGGAGDDTLYGDVDLLSANPDWSVARLPSVQDGVARYDVTFGNLIFQNPTDATLGQADVIHGGAGKDWIFAGGGDDFVDTGSGDDVVLGEGGSDILIGGTGDDVLEGDSASTPLALQGDDYLDG
ncbi:MAG: calcium-binding protein, partial [Armatimonadota bacterium]